MDNNFLVFVSLLNKYEISYMVTGSFACIVYGEPRMTNDIDIVIQNKFASKIPQIFSNKNFYVPPEETLKVEASRTSRGHFNLIHFESGLKGDFYFSGQDELMNWGLNNRQEVKVENHVVYLAPVEYVILMKLNFYREGKSDKHIQDIRGVLDYSGDQINQEILSNGLREFGLEEIYKQKF